MPRARLSRLQRRHTTSAGQVTGMRIVHVLHSAGYGGAENHALVLMKEQARLGHAVLYAGMAGSWLAQRCVEEGIAQLDLRMAGLFDVVSHLKLRRHVRAWSADIVHGHLVRGAHYAGWGASGSAAAICTAHATTADKHMGRCKRIIAVSDAVRQAVLARGYAPSNVTVIHNGMPDPGKGGDRLALRHELGIRDHEFALVNVGRFVRDKGQDLIIQALALCPPSTRLYLIGDANTDFGQRVLDLARQTGLGEGRVHFLGYRDDVQHLLPAFDAYVSASRREALGLSLVEAAAASLPTVATAVGGVPEVVIDGVTGRLVPSEDPRALGDAITRLVSSPDKGRAQGEAARHHYLGHFTVDHMTRRTLQLYEAIRQEYRA